MLEKVDIPVDGDLAALPQQRVTALQDVPQAPNDFPLLCTRTSTSLLAATPVGSPLQDAQQGFSIKQVRPGIKSMLPDSHSMTWSQGWWQGALPSCRGRKSSSGLR